MNPLNLVKDTDSHRSFDDGEILFRAGEQGDYLYIVVNGEVYIETNGVRVRTLLPGDLFGEMSLIDDSPRSADAVAGPDCVVAVIDERRFLFLIHETPMFAVHVMGVMAERLRGHLNAKAQ